VDNGNGTLTQTTHYNNATFNAATTALAMLAGGGLASALGADAQSAANAAQNESINNATSDKTVVQKVVDWAKWTYADPFGDMNRWARNFLATPNSHGDSAQTNPERQVDSTSGPSKGGPTGVAPVTPFAVLACLETGGLACGLFGLFGAAPSSPPPSNAILSDSSNASDSGGSASGQGANSATSNSANTLANNRLTGKVAEVEVGTSLKGQGLDVQPQVSITSDSTRAVADFAVNGRPNATVQVPPGYVAEDISGKPLLGANGAPIKSFNLNAEGQAIVEVKTGGAALTSNQSNVYPAVQSGTAKPVGGNATNAFGTPLPGNLEKTPVVVLRKK
ncbi:hypothetical protein LBW59_24275, partial [Ralstonia solanacearum]|nr:hypothetical protein [Ralstonia solanacearum]